MENHMGRGVSLRPPSPECSCTGCVQLCDALTTFGRYKCDVRRTRLAAQHRDVPTLVCISEPLPARWR